LERTKNSLKLNSFLMKQLILILFFLIGGITASYAQAPPPPPPPPPPGGGGGTSVPIDNDVIILFTAAGLFGVWKLRNQKIIKQ
jgi:hypothetical protein